MTRILLAHDGSWLTLAAIPWLANRHGAEVATLTLDLGQPGRLAEVREQALAAGAERAHVIDAREHMAEQVVLPALRAGAISVSQEDPLVAPLASPVVARHVAEVAAMEKASAVAHGSTTGRLARLLAGLTATPVLPSLAEVISGEEQAALTAQIDAGIASEAATPGGSTAIGATLWGRPALAVGPTFRSGVSAIGSRESAIVEIAFGKGVPTGINGVTMPFLELIGSLETIAAGHGVGMFGVGNQESGLPAEARSQTGTGPPSPKATAGSLRLHPRAKAGIGNQETGIGGTRVDISVWHAPAALILSRALHALEMQCLSPRLLDLRRPLARAYADVLHEGGWFLSERGAIDAFTAHALDTLDGCVRFELCDGQLRLTEVAGAGVGEGTMEGEGVTR